MTDDGDDRDRAHEAAARAVAAMTGDGARTPRGVAPDTEPMIRLWHGMQALRHSDDYAALLGTPTWRERAVALHARVAAHAVPIAWSFASAGAAAVALYLAVPHPARYEAGDRARRITLADRSSVTLAPSSTLRFEASGGRRRATLVGGARFAVAHDPAHPFLIDVGGAQVQVVGTRFTLTYRKPCMQLLVASGSVVLRAPGMAPRRLSSGEEAAGIEEGHGPGDCPAGLAGGAALRWSYVDVPLSAIVDDIRRLYPHRIVIASSRLAAERVTASFRIDEIDGFVNALPALVDADVRRDAGVVRVVPAHAAGRSAGSDRAVPRPVHAR